MRLHLPLGIFKPTRCSLQLVHLPKDRRFDFTRSLSNFCSFQFEVSSHWEIFCCTVHSTPYIGDSPGFKSTVFFWNYWSHVSYWKIEGIGLTSIFSFFSPSNVGKPNGLIFHQCCSLVSPPSFCIQRDFKPPVVFWIHSPLNFLHPDRSQAIFFNPFSFQCWKGKRFELTMSQNIQPPIFEIQKTKHKS